MPNCVRRTGGFSLVEALVSISLFLVGAVAIMFLFPQTLHASYEAELLSKAAFLAQLKAEEIRRDDDQARTMSDAIAIREVPTDPIPFAQEPDLSYSFSGRSLLYREEDPFVPDSHAGVARVIIFRNRGGQIPTPYFQPKDVLYELRFAP